MINKIDEIEAYSIPVMKSPIDPGYTSIICNRCRQYIPEGSICLRSRDKISGEYVRWDRRCRGIIMRAYEEATNKPKNKFKISDMASNADDEWDREETISYVGRIKSTILWEDETGIFKKEYIGL